MREVEIEGEPGSTNAGQKFFADDLEMNTKTGELTAPGNVVFSDAHGAHRRRQRGVQHQDQARQVRQRVRALPSSASAASANQSMFGTLEPDVYFYGELDREDRPRQVPDHATAVLRRACSRRRVGRSSAAARRSTWTTTRSCSNAVIRGEGRSGFLPADVVLPDPGRRSGHRLPDADLRLVARAGRRSATRSSGRSTAARTPRSSTTGCSRAATASAPSIATCWPAGAGQLPLLLAQRERSDRQRRTAQSARQSKTIQGGLARTCRRPVGARPRRLLHQRHGRSRPTTTTSTSARTASRTIDGGVSGAWRDLSA